MTEPMQKTRWNTWGKLTWKEITERLAELGYFVDKNKHVHKYHRVGVHTL